MQHFGRATDYFARADEAAARQRVFALNWGDEEWQVAGYSERVLTGVSTAVTAARVARDVLAEDPGALVEAWRHGVLQLLDDYERVRRRSGVEAAARLFAEAPSRCGDARVDAALAGLAEHLARRDGWPPPSWAFEPDRYAEPWWFVAGLRSLRPMALVRSPTAFRKRGVFITTNALERV